MELRLNKSLKLADSMVSWHPPDCSGPAPTFVPFCGVSSTPPVCSTMPEMTLFRYPEFSCRRKFNSDSWLFKHIKLHHPEHYQVALQIYLTICSAPRRVEPAQDPVFKVNKGWFEDLDAFPYLEQVESIADSESQPPPPPLQQTETYTGAGALLGEYIAEPWEHHAHGCLETNLPNNPYYLFAMWEEYKYIQCGIKKKGMKTYNDNVLKEETTELRFPSFQNVVGVQVLVASMPGDQALRQWELHTLEDIRWSDNNKCPIKYWSRDIIKSITWLMQQPA